MAFGQPVETRYDFSKRDVILSLDADFLSAGFPGRSATREITPSGAIPDSGTMNRMYCRREHIRVHRGEGGPSACPRTSDIERLVSLACRRIDGKQPPALVAY